MKKKDCIILVGGFHEIIELCEMCNKQIIGIVDNNLKGEHFGYPILGDDSCVLSLYKKFKDIPLLVTPDSPQIKKRLSNYYSKIGFKFCNLIHPQSTISKYSKIGNGIIIQNGVNVSTGATIEDFVKLNSCANVMHDSKIGKYSTIAPNAVILGRVNISESCYVGANSTILPEVNIGNYAIVGAGAIVTKDVKEKTTVISVAAREKPKE
ncbi:MAG: acetyltransferase [Candidatus Omnitrophica bacterium]|nr:acetyltransferase [Candidatus Omnitrophota bacterium]